MIRVQMPAIDTPERRKNARLVVVKTQAEADELVAEGGKVIPKGEEPPEVEPVVGVAPMPEPRAEHPRQDPNNPGKPAKKDTK